MPFLLCSQLLQTSCFAQDKSQRTRAFRARCDLASVSLLISFVVLSFTHSRPMVSSLFLNCTWHAPVLRPCYSPLPEFSSPPHLPRASLVAQLVKNLPAIQETLVQFLGREDALEMGWAAHSSILAWRIPWTEEPGGLQSMGSRRVRRDWVTKRAGTQVERVPGSHIRQKVGKKSHVLQTLHSENKFVSRKRIWQRIIQRTFSSVFLGVTWGGSARIVMPRVMDGCLIPHCVEEELESSALPPPPPCHQPLLTGRGGGLGGGNPHGRWMGAGQSRLVLHACVIFNISWQVQKMTHSPLLLWKCPFMFHKQQLCCAIVSLRYFHNS